MDRLLSIQADPSPGTVGWIVLKRAEFLSAFHAVRWRRDVAKNLYEMMRDSGDWQLLEDMNGRRFRTFDAFCRDGNGLGQPREKIEERLTIAQAMAQKNGVSQLSRHGANQHTIGVDNVNSSEGGNSAAYLVARLKRDAPEYAERLANKEFRSARAAAIAAGIITPESPLRTLLHAWERASQEERDTFHRMALAPWSQRQLTPRKVKP